jgi:hypothetical protein
MEFQANVAQMLTDIIAKIVEYRLRDPAVIDGNIAVGHRAQLADAGGRPPGKAATATRVDAMVVPIVAFAHEGRSSRNPN